MACASGTRALLEEEDNDTFCVSCIEIGYLKTAEIYCVNCGRYLCNRCAEYHQREESSKKQKPPNKDQERDTLTSSDVIDDKPDECVQRCVIHVKQVMEYYCENHRKLCCIACIMLEHTYCSKKYIPTASENIFKTEVYREFKADIQGFIKDSHDNQQKLDKTLEFTRKDASDKLDDIRRQRQAVNAYFDKSEENLKRQCRQAYTDTTNHIDEVIKENKNLLIDLYKMNVEMNAKEQNVQQCQVFVKLKQWHDLPKQYAQRLADITAGGRVHHYRFEPSDYFEIQDSKYFGHLVLQPELVNVKQDSETICDIREMAILPNGTIALADYENDYIKVMYPRRLQVTPELMYHTIGPVGLAKSSLNQFAVSTYNGRVDVIDVSYSYITFVRGLYRPSPSFFKLIGHSLCYTNMGLIMASGFKSFPRSGKFEYVSRDNSLMQLIPWEIFDNLVDNTWSARHERFATCSGNGSIYRTLKQRRLRKLIRQNMNGDILSTYEHKQLPSPCGVGVSSSGTVYVCDDETHTVHVLTPDLNIKRILKVDFGGAKPRALAFCNTYELLYVCTDGNFICILRLPELS